MGATLGETTRLTGQKDGGAYVTTMAVRRIDPLEGRVVFTTGAVIPIKNILEMRTWIRLSGTCKLCRALV